MKPILFNTEMVRAILDGRKTVTRRVVKPQHLLVLDSPYHKKHPETPDAVLIEKLCLPPYQVGDILYVRETWKPIEACYPPSHCTIEYKAGGTKGFNEIITVPKHITSWRPSIHMPKEAARIFLRVKNVRVERLQDIDGYGVLAEGVDNGSANPTMGKRWENMQRMAYSKLWNTTVKKSDLDKCGWAANPWVWVIEFERISREETTCKRD